MPLHGFTRMFENMLDHPNIKVMLNTDYREVREFIPFKEMIYTGPIDEYFDYRFGKLPYRCLEFKHETHDRPLFQPASVVNYPNDYAYTRITEFKYLTGQEHPKTSIVYEFPQAEGDPYYPIPRAENSALVQAVTRTLADQTTEGTFTSWDGLPRIKLLQHGPGRRRGTDDVQENHGRETRRYERHQQPGGHPGASRRRTGIADPSRLCSLACVARCWA